MTKLSNNAVNDFDTKKSTYYSRLHVATELDVSGIKCIQFELKDPIETFGKTNIELGVHIQYKPHFGNTKKR